MEQATNNMLPAQAMNSGGVSWRFTVNSYFKAFCHGISKGSYSPPNGVAIGGELLVANHTQEVAEKKKNELKDRVGQLLAMGGKMSMV